MSTGNVVYIPQKPTLTPLPSRGSKRGIGCPGWLGDTSAERRARVALVVGCLLALLGLVGCGGGVDPAEAERNRRAWGRRPAEYCLDYCRPAPVLSFQRHWFSGTDCKCGALTADGGAR